MHRYEETSRVLFEICFPIQFDHYTLLFGVSVARSSPIGTSILRERRETVIIQPNSIDYREGNELIIVKKREEETVPRVENVGRAKKKHASKW